MHYLSPAFLLWKKGWWQLHLGVEIRRPSLSAGCFRLHPKELQLRCLILLHPVNRVAEWLTLQPLKPIQ